MKGMGDINDKKNMMLPSHRFITLTNNAYATLAKNDDTDDNNLYAPVSILKQDKDDNSFDNYIASKIGVYNNSALVKKVKTANKLNNSISTTNIVDTSGTGNTSDNTIKSSKVGAGKKESNTVTVDNVERINRIKSHNNDNHNVVTTTIKKKMGLRYDDDKSTSINASINDYNLIYNTNLDLEKESPPHHKKGSPPSCNNNINTYHTSISLSTTCTLPH